MANLASVTDNYFTVASESFTDNLSSSILAGATIVPVNNASEYTNGDCVVLTVDPGTVNEATFIGVKNGNQFEECVWTEGNTAVGHSAGATIIDYDSATHHSAQSKGIKQFANDDGSLKTQPVRDALGLGSSAVNGWEVFPNTMQVSTGYNKGNKEFDIVVPNADVTSTLFKGMKLRLQRGTTPGTQCTDLESSSSQFWQDTSLAGPLNTVTDDITVEAWVKLESYVSAAPVVSCRSAAGNGFDFLLLGGQLRIHGVASAGNHKLYQTVQSIPLADWMHIAGSMDMSADSGILYFNGISVLVTTSHSGVANAFANGNRINIGSDYSATYFDGKIADVRVWNIVRTQTQIRDNMNQQLVGSETNLIGYWKFDGNGNDSTSNANHLTANGGATATTTDNPFSATEYAIITKVAYSAPNTTVTVFTGTDHNIPNMTLSAPYYSTQKSPYGFPTSKLKWQVKMLNMAQRYISLTTAVIAQITGTTVAVPTGAWKALQEGELGMGQAGAAAIDFRTYFGTSTTDLVPNMTTRSSQSWTGTYDEYTISQSGDIDVTTQTQYSLIMMISAGGGSITAGVRGVTGFKTILECAYI